MNKGPILYVGGDGDDRHLVNDALSDIGFTCTVVNFDNGNELIEYLRSSKEQPFPILSDLHLPKMSGLELKNAINADDKLKRRAIPFIFLSESVKPRDVLEAYMSLMQGFYIKAKTYAELKEQLQAICNYWQKATLPSESVV